MVPYDAVKIKFSFNRGVRVWENRQGVLLKFLPSLLLALHPYQPPSLPPSVRSLQCHSYAGENSPSPYVKRSRGNSVTSSQSHCMLLVKQPLIKREVHTVTLELYRSIVVAKQVIYCPSQMLTMTMITSTRGERVNLGGRKSRFPSSTAVFLGGVINII